MRKLFMFLVLALAGLSVNAQVLYGNRYRGFVDFNVSPGNDGVYYEMNTLGFGITTSQGYQINPYVYVGAGLGVQYCNFDNFESSVSVPIFANLRANFTRGMISPFFDAKIGYSTVDLEGLFLSPSFGVRFGLRNNMGINLQVGYTLQGYDYVDYHLYYSHLEKAYQHSVNISLGIDW